MDNDLDPMDDAIARVLDGRRVERRLTIADIATATGLNLRTTRRYLKGERGMATSKFYAVCLAVGVEPGDVVEAALNILTSSEYEPRGQSRSSDDAGD